MDFFNWLRSIFCERYIPPPVDVKVYPHQKIKNLLLGQLPISEACSVFLLDRDYELPDKKDIVRFLEKDKTNYYKYSKEEYDCEKFTYRLMGNLSVPGWADLAVFFMCGNHHAFASFIDSDDKVWVIEPQSDRVIKPSELSERYKPIWFIMK